MPLRQMKCPSPLRTSIHCAVSDEPVTCGSGAGALGTCYGRCCRWSRRETRLVLVGHDLYSVQWPWQSLGGTTALLSNLELLLGAHPHHRKVAPARRPAY